MRRSVPSAKERRRRSCTALYLPPFVVSSIAPRAVTAASPSVRPSRALAALPRIDFPDELPVCARREEIARAIETNPVVIVCGETGSGKTTQLPKICLALGRGRDKLIGHTQPRRIAASSVARRIAQELNTPLGDVVGYKVRFADHTRPGAAIKLMTDGILLAETQSDPLLAAYDTIIVDEAHERSLNIDFLLGYLKQLLPRRPDLKLIITSATIDAERFAAHFGTDGKPAPVINVSGRLYPVEIRYRPVKDEDDADDRTLMDAIVDAVDECALAGPGDVLVFLPGEREIREAAEALRKHHPPGTEILPLFARLSAEEQERVFKPGGARRIVLATNVAETSLTVPGIRYVVDTGLARVKRYSYRNKVEQLQVEPISQAAANQRAGRCGRVAAGVCIRLYDEAEFAKRPKFTDPEILRSSLASVILRMKSLGLGDVRAFPFVEPPPARAIADGFDLLAELNAVDEDNELTPVGRELARLPVDPRIGRMLLAARDHHALAEVLIIAAALSVQDPRERPLEAQQAADQAHRKFADEKSDFLAFVKLWNFVAERFEHKKSNRKLTEELKSHFLSPRRVREWREVHSQLAAIAGEMGWRQNATPATFEQVHLSLLAGLLGNVGFKTLDADYREPPYVGARGIKFYVWPGSPLAKKAGRWVMAAELVETTRLFARCVATIEPQWLERVGGHLLKKSWSDPHWEKKPAQVIAFERATLYGLVVYSQRRVEFGSKDPRAAREIFIRAALVEGEYETQAPFFAHNRGLVREIRELEHKTRRPDVLVDDELIYRFYDALIPADVCSGATFEKWRRTAEEVQPKLLFLSRDELMRHDARGVTTELFPKRWEMRGVAMALTYHFEPGSPRDGVTLTVPLVALNQVDAVRCDWLVPGMLKEKVHLLLKSLPQKLRRHCVPLPEYAAGFVERHAAELAAPRRPLIEALIADLREQRNVVCQPGDFKLEMLPAHLTMNFKVVDEHGRQLGMGRSLAALRAELGQQAQQRLREVAAQDAKTAAGLHGNITDWDFGELPELLEIERKGQRLIGFPALVDRGDRCEVEVFDDAEQARAKHRDGLRRLFRLQLKEQVKFVERSLSVLQAVQMQAGTVPALAAALPSFEELRDQVITAAIDRTCLVDPWPTDNASFFARKNDARGKLSLIAQEVARLVTAIVQEAAALPKKLAAARAFGAAVADIEQQLARLFQKRFIVDTPPAQLAHYPRYLKAIALRLDKLKADPARDAQRMSEVAQLQAPYLRELAARKGVADPRLEEFRWLLEELRVSLFAQELRTPMPVSVKRLTKAWESLRR
ncbi:MAG TPA: ATP-dependent RNA helicase HrpA [Burkholderiaceae bacterium]|nr:ATP-dependent RNA helicase HrpA [Burkholderiaceae bacterium]